jgi:retron-type reverse transcriptase
MGVLQQVEGGLTDMVKEITNERIRKGKWPGAWKKAEIVPLWKKKGNKEDVKFYRPVAILPAISRVVERILINQLKKFIRKNEIIPPHQHGFKEKHSTVSAIIQLIDLISAERDRGNIVVVISMDLAGAFDTVDHEMLVEKLRIRMGMEETHWHYSKTTYKEGCKGSGVERGEKVNGERWNGGSRRGRSWDPCCSPWPAKT